MAPQIDMQRKGEHGEDTVRRLLRGLTIPWPVERGLLTLAKSLESTKSQLKARLSEKTQRYQAHFERQASRHKLELEEARAVLEKADADHEGEVRALNHNLVQANFDSGIQTYNFENLHASHAMEIKSLENEHELQIQSLTEELEQARRDYSGDDDLVELYHAGTRLLAKQTAELKSLKAETQREKDDHERLKKSFTLEMAEKDNEKAVLTEAVQRLEGRLASLTTESTDAEADLKRRLAGSRDQRKAAVARSNKLEVDVLAAKKVIDDLRREIGEGMNADLLERLRKVEQHCDGYRSAALDQQKLIEKLSKENAKLAGDFGRQHIYRDV